VNNLLVEMRALALSAANGATTNDQRAALNEAFQGAVASINSIVSTTRYAGAVIFDGTFATVDYLLGEETTDTVTVDITDLVGDDDLGALAEDDLTSDAAGAVVNIDAFQATVSGLRGELGAVQKYIFESRERTLATQIENISAAESNIRDANIAEETSNFVKYQILTQAGIAVLGQANMLSQSVLQLLG